MRLAVKIAIKSILQQIFIVPLALLYYKIKLQSKKCCNIVVCSHIGDFIFTMGYVKTLKREKQIEMIRVISTERMRPIATLYNESNFEFKAISAKWLHVLEIADRYNCGKQAFRCIKNNYFVVPANWFTLGIDGATRNKNNNLKECVKSYCLDIHTENGFEAPVTERSNSNKLNKVLLCMDAESITWNECEVYEKKLLESLTEEGYEIEINGKDSFYSLDKFITVCDTFCAIIGVRSGILDLAAFSSAKIVALYPSESEKYIHFYDICKTNENKKNVIQIVLGSDIENDIKIILDYIRKDW